MPDLNSVERHVREAVLASLKQGELPETRLSIGPRGYLLVYAFESVDSDICNGGFDQAHENSTWTLMPLAIETATLAGAQGISRVLREAVIYFHQEGRCGMDRGLCERLSVGLDRPMLKSLDSLDDEYYAMEEDRKLVVERLVQAGDAALWEM